MSDKERGIALKKNVSKFLTILFSLVFATSSFSLIYILIIQPSMNNKKIEEIRSVYYSQQEGIAAFEPNPINKLLSLLEINEDIKGWIKIDNTFIDYPVLKSSTDDPDYYLYRNYKKERSKFGSIFIDSNSREDVQSKNILVHGHHMNDGSMFAGILKYTHLDFYKLTPSFTFDTIFESAKWKVISVFRTNTLPEHGPIFDYLRGSFSNGEDFMNFVKEIRDRSIIITPVDVDAADRLVTLSTCSYEFKDFRTVVVARKVREGEDESVNVDQAIVNPNPVLPQCYYR